MGTKIAKIAGDDNTTLKVKFPKSAKETAGQENYITNTRLLLLFDTDKYKGKISKKELDNFATLQENYFVDLYDDNGKKVRYVEQLDDNGNYLVYEYENDKRTTSSILNVVTGKEEVSVPTFDENGNENGYTLYNNGVPAEGKQVIFDKNKRPVKIIEKQMIYDSKGNLTSEREQITEYKYNKDGSVKDIKYTVNEKLPAKNQSKNLDINS